MQLSYVQPGMVLTTDIMDERGNLLLESGITLTAAYISRLKQLGITAIHVADPIAELLSQPALSPGLRDELAQCFRSVFTLKVADLTNQHVRITQLEQMKQTVDKVITETGKRLPYIMNVKVRQPSEDEIQHGINVCLLSLVTGLYLKMPQPLLKDLALGALLHDIGKTALPQQSLSVPEPMHFHPLFSRELLLKAYVNPTVACIAAEHHERYDGSGYPLGLSGKNLHPLSRLVAIANYYDTAMNNAAYTQASRQEIVETMMAAGNTQFDLNSLRAFFHSVAVFPVGSLVELNTHKSGYVVKNSTHYPLRPVVRIFDDTSYTDIDLTLKPNITILQVIKE